MKRKFSGALCLLLIFCLMCSVTAYAADETEIQTIITYTTAEEPEQEEPPAETEPPAVDSGDYDEPVNIPVYEIAIPSEMSLNNGTTIPIYLITNNLTDEQTLNVYIDADRTLADDGYLHLQGTNTDDVAKVVVGYYNSAGKPTHINNSGIWQVGIFESGNIRPVRYGTIYFNVVNDSELAADTYTGTVYFVLDVSNS